MPRVAELELKIEELRNTIHDLKEALIWCSGAEEFQVNGKAREGWLKVCYPLIKGKK